MWRAAIFYFFFNVKNICPVIAEISGQIYMWLKQQGICSIKGTWKDYFI